MAGPEEFGQNPYADNRPVSGQLVTLLRGVTDKRGLEIEAYRSRAVIAGQVHELMVTDEPDAGPGDKVDRVALIGFFVVEQSGVIVVGANLEIDSRPIGTVAGFNDTHMPNHQNVCIQAQELADGVDLMLAIGARVRFGGGD